MEVLGPVLWPEPFPLTERVHVLWAVFHGDVSDHVFKCSLSLLVCSPSQLSGVGDEMHIIVTWSIYSPIALMFSSSAIRGTGGMN